MIKELKSFLFPDYDELSVFLMSLVLMLLLYFDVGCRDEILSYEPIMQTENFRLTLYLLPLQH